MASHNVETNKVRSCSAVKSPVILKVQESGQVMTSICGFRRYIYGRVYVALGDIQLKVRRVVFGECCELRLRFDSHIHCRGPSLFIMCFVPI